MEISMSKWHRDYGNHRVEIEPNDVFYFFDIVLFFPKGTSLKAWWRPRGQQNDLW